MKKSDEGWEEQIWFASESNRSQSVYRCEIWDDPLLVVDECFMIGKQNQLTFGVSGFAGNEEVC